MLDIITIIIAIVFAIVFVTMIDPYTTIGLIINSIFGLIAGAFLSIMIVFIFVGIFGALSPPETTIKETEHEIVTLQDSNSTSGDFFLGTGYVNEEMQYIYYRKDGNGYKMEQIKARDARIEYTEKTPKVIKQEKEATDAFWNKFKINWDDEPTYIIQVPKGTIKQDYSLDAR